MTVLVYPIWFCTCVPGIYCSITLPCSMELYISYFIDPWVGIETQLLIYSACLLHPTCNYYMHTFIYCSIFTAFYPLFIIIQAFYNFWVVDYASKFQSEMLYLLKLWYFSFLLISTTIEVYCRYTCFWSKLQILGHFS